MIDILEFLPLNTDDLLFFLITFVLIIVFIFYLVKYVTNSHNSYVITSLITILYMILYYSNVLFLKNIKKLDLTINELYKNLNTGDFILFRTKKHNVIATALNYLLVPINNYGFTHIGLIIKDTTTDTLYIIENTLFKTNNYLGKNTIKSGVMMTNMIDRIKNGSYDDIIIIKTNLNEYILKNELYFVLNNYIDKNFFENMLNCSNTIYFILKELKLIKKKFIEFLVPTHYFFDKDNYLVNIEFTEPVRIST